MHRLEILISSPGLPLPASGLKTPFAVLLDTRDPEWSEKGFLARKTGELLEAGCRYYVCFGSNAELVHDRVDDVILEKAGEEDIPTTFHDDEAIEDVVNFFINVVMREIPVGLILSNGSEEWILEDFLRHGGGGRSGRREDSRR